MGSSGEIHNMGYASYNKQKGFCDFQTFFWHLYGWDPGILGLIYHMEFRKRENMDIFDGDGFIDHKRTIFRRNDCT